MLHACRIESMADLHFNFPLMGFYHCNFSEIWYNNVLKAAIEIYYLFISFYGQVITQCHLVLNL